MGETNKGARHLTWGRRYYLGPYCLQLTFNGPLQISAPHLQLTHLDAQSAFLRSGASAPVNESLEQLKAARKALRAAQSQPCRCTHLTLQATLPCSCGRQEAVEDAQGAIEAAILQMTGEEEA